MLANYCGLVACLICAFLPYVPYICVVRAEPSSEQDILCVLLVAVMEAGAGVGTIVPWLNAR